MLLFCIKQWCHSEIRIAFKMTLFHVNTAALCYSFRHTVCVTLAILCLDDYVISVLRYGRCDNYDFYGFG